MDTISDKSLSHGKISAAGATQVNPISQHLRNFGPAIAFALLIGIVDLIQPAFLKGTGPSILVYQAVPILILALGQSAAMMTGGIDLSNAALAVLSGVLVASGLEHFGVWAVVFTIVAVTLAGAINGFLVAVFQVPSLAVTLGLFGFWQAVALLITNEQTLYVSANGEVLNWIADRYFGVEAAVYVALVLTGFFWFALRSTVVGRALRAVGLNERASILSGVRTRGIKVWAFAFSGFCAAIAGIALTAQQGTASASGLGVGLLLPAIAAAVVGGTAITGGVCMPWNVVFGALVVTLIPIGSSVVGFDPRVQQIVFGVMMIVAIAVTLDRKKLSVFK